MITSRWVLSQKSVLDVAGFQGSLIDILYTNNLLIIYIVYNIILTTYYILYATHQINVMLLNLLILTKI